MFLFTSLALISLVLLNVVNANNRMYSLAHIFKFTPLIRLALGQHLPMVSIEFKILGRSSTWTLLTPSKVMSLLGFLATI